MNELALVAVGNGILWPGQLVRVSRVTPVYHFQCMQLSFSFPFTTTPTATSSEHVQ
jgi:hypothetical protein